MSINIDMPQVAALRNEIEKNAGKMTAHTNFIRLQELIYNKCKENISVTTLERIWGYSTRSASNVSVRILDILSQYVDNANWEDFCSTLRIRAGKESEMFSSDNSIKSCELKEGTCIRLGWLPDRICEVQYIGNNRFVALRTVNSSIKPGDSFCCIQIQKGRELYMDCFKRSGEDAQTSTARYVVGQMNGITLVEFIQPEQHYADN